MGREDAEMKWGDGVGIISLVELHKLNTESIHERLMTWSIFLAANMKKNDFGEKFLAFEGSITHHILSFIYSKTLILFLKRPISLPRVHQFYRVTY